MALQLKEAAAREEPVGVPAVVFGYFLVPAERDCLSCRPWERRMLAAAATDRYRKNIMSSGLQMHAAAATQHSLRALEAS